LEAARPGHILVVDDEEDVREVIEEYLSREGYRVSTAPNGEAMRSILSQSPVDLIVLDLILPGEDGLALARALRAEQDVGIIILSGRGDTVDRIVGLEMGSDDYLPKPFEMRELSARVKSILRRRVPAPPPAAEAGERLGFAGWRLDLASRTLVAPGGEPVALTSSEFALLSAFVGSANKVLSRERLSYLVHGREPDPCDRSIDVLTSRLRRKLRDDSRSPELIKGVRGIGYIFAQPVEPWG
jgi:two-component system OmpR family response regulator